MIDIHDPANRLAPRIGRARDCLSRRVRIDNGQPLPASLDLATFERTLDNSFSDHVAFQNLQARSFAMGKLSYPEAQIIYAALGDPPAESGWASATDLATKLIVTEVLRELLTLGGRTR